MASRLQDVILRGLSTAKPLATTVAPGTLYYSTDTATTERSDGSTWESYADGVSGGGGGSPHAATHSQGGTDAVDVKNLDGYPGGITTFLRADKSFAVPPAGVPTAHATTHEPSGSDPMAVDAAVGVGSLRTIGTGPTQAAAGNDPRFTRFGSITMIIDGGASVITTGLKGFLEIPFACQLQAVTLLGDVSGSIVIDIWKDVYLNYPPTAADTITAAAKPTISSALKSQDVALTGWNKTINAGDILGFNVDSVTSIKRVTLSLKFQVT